MKLNKKQQEILKCALPLFREKGYAGTSMRDLASKMNIKAASLYAHLQSKEQILEWLCFGLADDFFTGLQNAVGSGLSGTELVEKFVSNHLEVVLANPERTQVYSNEWRHLEHRSAEFQQLRKQYESEVSTLLRNVFNNPLLSDSELYFSTRYLLYTLNTSYQCAGRLGQIDIVRDKIIQKVLYGLLGP